MIFRSGFWYTCVFTGALTGALFASSCRDTVDPAEEHEIIEDITLRGLVSPNGDALSAAEAFLVEEPGAKIRFSQVTGEILWVRQSDGLWSGTGAPDTEDEALERVLEFLEAYPDLYRITSPRAEIGADNLYPDTAFRKDPDSGITTLRFRQYSGNAMLLYRYGLAYFNRHGELTDLVTHLEPTENINVLSSVKAARPKAGINQKFGGHFAGQIFLYETSPGIFKHVRVETDPDLVEGIGVIKRRIVDAVSGSVLEERDETQSLVPIDDRAFTFQGSGGGASETSSSDACDPTINESSLPTPEAAWSRGTLVYARASDAQGEVRNVLSTDTGSGLALGFHLEGIHAEGYFVTVGDALNAAFVPTDPIATTEYSWTEESYYQTCLTDATRLTQNIESVIDWFEVNFSLASWNNEGATLYAATRINLTTSETDLNAYGGNGLVAIGNGRTETGQTLGDALDIIAHEYMHSVTTATTNFSYWYESGALNESLSDVFGKSVEGFSTTTIGDEAGWALRDILNPSSIEHPYVEWGYVNYFYPERYSDFIVLSSDGAGVHTNSSIMNRALALPILGEEGVVSAWGSQAVTDLVLDSLWSVSYDPDNSMEEFAAALSAFCLGRKKSQALTGSQEGLCEGFEDSFLETELLSDSLRI